MAKFNYNKVFLQMEKIREQQETELNRLLANPDTFHIAQAMLDTYVGCLDYLCNFDHLVSGKGHKVSPVDVMEKIEDLMAAEFQKMTGKPYENEVMRRPR